MKKHNIVRNENIYDYEVYRIFDFDNVKELDRAVRDTTSAHAICEVAIFEEYGEKYIFGTSRNGYWHGYKLRQYKGCENLFELFARYEEV